MANELVKQETGIQEITTPRGFENTNIETISLPTAKLLQGLSPEVTEEEFADYGFRAGMIIHSLLLEKLPESFTPLMMLDDNILFVPRQEDKKQALKVVLENKFREPIADEDMQNMFLCRAQDGRNGDRFGSCASCKLNKFNGNEKPYCTANISVLALFEGQAMPVVIRFSNTSYKHGKAFKDLTFYAGTDLFARKYKLTPTKKSKGSNTWYEMVVKPAGANTGEELAKAEAIYNRFKGVSIQVDEAQAESSAGEDIPF